MLNLQSIFKGFYSFVSRAKAAPVYKVYRIGLSPGHGGEDPGCHSALGQTEADTARQLCLRLYLRFKQNPLFSVAIYGYDEKKKNYSQRVKDSDAGHDDLYVPIHFNASENKEANGWLVMVDPDDAQKNSNVIGLALSVINHLQAFKPIGFQDWDTRKDGVMQGIGRVVYELGKPAADTIYLELGFLSNMGWAEQLKDLVFQERLADAIVRGFEDYLNIVIYRKG